MKLNVKICGSIASLLMGAAFIVGPAGAGVPSQVVKFDDLNLQSTRGVERLYQRILTAAHDVCDSGIASFDLGGRARHQSCMEQAEDRAIRQINSASVTAFHQNRTGRPLASFAAN